MPAYNAAQILRQTHDEVMVQDVVDLVIVVDDCNSDETTAIAKTLPETIVRTHPKIEAMGPVKKPVISWL